jgi:hypothetical protein
MRRALAAILIYAISLHGISASSRSISQVVSHCCSVWPASRSQAEGPTLNQSLADQGPHPVRQASLVELTGTGCR